MLPDLRIYDPQYHLLIQRDIISIINGIVDSFHGKVITKPSILRKTENKVYQMVYVTRGCLLVLHRIRNNLMHGMKLLEGLDGQIELFRAATAVLESIAG